MSHELSEHVSREVRAEMARQRATQRQVADLLGVSQPQIWKRLKGDIEFRLSELEALAHAWDVPISQFMPAATPASSS